MEKTLENSSYVTNENIGCGTVKIADDVVAMIAGLACQEVDGVTSMATNIGDQLFTKMGFQNLTQGVKTEITGNNVKVAVAVVVDYSYNIPSVSAKIQEKVKQSIETMTGLNVTDVNVRVAGVDVKAR